MKEMTLAASPSLAEEQCTDAEQPERRGLGRHAHAQVVEDLGVVELVVRRRVTGQASIVVAERNLAAGEGQGGSTNRDGRNRVVVDRPDDVGAVARDRERVPGEA